MWLSSSMCVYQHVLETPFFFFKSLPLVKNTYMVSAQLHGELFCSRRLGLCAWDHCCLCHSFSRGLYVPLVCKGKVGNMFLIFWIHPFVPSPRVGHWQSSYHFPHNRTISIYTQFQQYSMWLNINHQAWKDPLIVEVSLVLQMLSSLGLETFYNSHSIIFQIYWVFIHPGNNNCLARDAVHFWMKQSIHINTWSWQIITLSISEV